MPFLSNLFKKAAVQEAAPAPVSPTPFLTNLLSGTAAAMPQDYVTAMPQERKATVSGSRSAVTPKKKSPLSKKTTMEKESKEIKDKALSSVREVMGLGQNADAVGQEIADSIQPSELDRAQRTVDVFDRLKGFRQTAKPGDRLDTKLFESMVPKDPDFFTALNQGLDLQAATNPEDLANVNENKNLQAVGKKLLQEKMDRPFRNVNYEFIDRAVAGLGGARPLGLKNDPGPEDNVQMQAALNKLKQQYDQFRAKEVGDYATSVLRPIVSGGVTSQVLPPPVPRQGRAAPQAKEIRVKEIAEYTKPGRAAINIATKARDLIAVMGEISKTPVSDLSKMKVLYDRYNTIKNNIQAESKEAKNFGAAFTNLEAKLNAANLPGNFVSTAALGSLGFSTKIKELEALAAEYDAEAARVKGTALQGYNREGEDQVIESQISGGQAKADAGVLSRKEVPKNIQDIINRNKKAK